MEREPVAMRDPLDYITLEEIEELYGINRDDSLALAKSQYFPSFKLSAKKFLIPRTAFMKFMTDPDRIINYKLKTHFSDDVK